MLALCKSWIALLNYLGREECQRKKVSDPGKKNEKNEAKFMGKTFPCLEFTYKRIHANGYEFFCLCWIKKFK